MNEMNLEEIADDRKTQPSAIEVATWFRQSRRHIVGPRLLVWRDEPERKSRGGIYIPDTSAHRNQKKSGTVVAVGDKPYATEFSVYEGIYRLGDQVTFTKYEMMEYLLYLKGVPYTADIMHVMDVLVRRPAEDEEEWIQLNER
jgi:co-chaperonin GroES (HSP10)